MQQTENPVGEAQPQESFSRTGKQTSNNKWLIPLGIVVIIILVVVAFFLFRSPQSEPEETNFIEPTFETESLPTPTPTPTPEPINRSEISIKVLNGTGIAREAGFLKGKLEELGYSEIEVGNADDQEMTTTEMKVSAGVPESVKNELEQILEGTYQSIEVSRGTSGDADVVITTGLRPGQSLPTPTPTIQVTPTPEATDSASDG